MLGREGGRKGRKGGKREWVTRLVMLGHVCDLCEPGHGEKQGHREGRREGGRDGGREEG